LVKGIAYRYWRFDVGGGNAGCPMSEIRGSEKQGLENRKEGRGA
jgi:hypothetical protein